MGEREQERTRFNPIKCRARIGVIIEMTMKYAGPARPLPLKQSSQSPKQRQLQLQHEKFADARQIRKTWDSARNLHRYQNATLKLIAFIAEATANKSQKSWQVNREIPCIESRSSCKGTIEEKLLKGRITRMRL